MPNYKKTTATVIGGRIGTAIGGGGHMSYIPVITYSYQVDGRQYTNNRFTENTVGRRMQGAVQKIVNQYPPNSTIEIFYNTDNPADSFVQKGFGGGVNRILWGMALTAILALIAVYLLTSQGII